MAAARASATFHAASGGLPVGWAVAPGPVAYGDAVAAMEARAGLVADGRAPELVWLLEHPPLYTAGTSARPGDLTDARFPVHRTGRGGRHTYHGPGQRVAYVMLDLRRRRPDVRAFVTALERWVAGALASFGLDAGPREGRVGVWVARPDKPPGVDGVPAEDKVAAIGVRLRRWVSFHGVSVNVEPDLSHFSGIVPCGIADAHLGVTSLADLGRPATMGEVDAALRGSFDRVFGPTVDEAAPGSAQPATASAS